MLYKPVCEEKDERQWEPLADWPWYKLNFYKEQTRPRTQRDVDDINAVLFSAVHPVPEGRVKDSNTTP